MSAVSERQYPQYGLDDCLAGVRLIPVITLHRVEEAVPLARALDAAGLHCLEFTLRTEAGLAGLKAVRRALPHLRLAAGSVRGIEDYHRAVSAGVDFVVSPGSTPTLLDYGVTAAVPLLPGITTASELLLGFERGYQQYKFFPAEAAGGAATLSALGGPFPDVRFVATGGIGPHNAGDYLALSQVAAVAGGWLAPQSLIARGDWEGIERLASESRSALL